MPKHRAIFRMTYEALAKWLGLPPDVEIISVSNEQEKEIASFHVRSDSEGYCPGTAEGQWALSRLVEKREMIAPVLDKQLIFKIGKFALYKVTDEGPN